MPKVNGNITWVYVNIGLCWAIGMAFIILSLALGVSAPLLLSGCACMLAGNLGMSVAFRLREHSALIHSLREELARRANSEHGASSGKATS